MIGQVAPSPGQNRWAHLYGPPMEGKAPWTTAFWYSCREGSIERLHLQPHVTEGRNEKGTYLP